MDQSFGDGPSETRSPSALRLDLAVRRALTALDPHAPPSSVVSGTEHLLEFWRSLPTAPRAPELVAAAIQKLEELPAEETSDARRTCFTLLLHCSNLPNASAKLQSALQQDPPDADLVALLSVEEYYLREDVAPALGRELLAIVSRDELPMHIVPLADALLGCARKSSEVRLGLATLLVTPRGAALVEAFATNGDRHAAFPDQFAIEEIVGFVGTVAGNAMYEELGRPGTCVLEELARLPEVARPSAILAAWLVVLERWCRYSEGKAKQAVSPSASTRLRLVRDDDPE